MSNEQKHIKSLVLTTKRKKQLLTVNYSQSEVGPKRQIWSPKFSKTSDQRLSQALENLFIMLQPHLLYANELAGTNIKLGKEIDDRKFFDEFEFLDIELFKGLQITRVEFIGNDAVDSVKLWGYRETQNRNKQFKVKLETGVINLSREEDNHYQLVHILADQVDDLQTSVQNWLSGETSDAPIVEEVPENVF